ncbi:hypothetical protein GCM10007939_06730 [Amylibacter marinus]|uniref:Competence protein ComEC n=2 Tax=Amylibacter marinus TaxID=1475483 RepID=A0ABQ5VSY1_9RHOB|nr:hypothetical protein GCM10007939_06730 [Amylibacter marinus]
MLLGIGIWGYFKLNTEPSASLFYAAIACCVICAVAFFILPEIWGVAFACVGLVALGFCLSMVRAHSVAQPVLGWRYYGDIEGQMVAMDRSSTGRTRITLANPSMPPISQARTPQIIRVSLMDESVLPEPGQRVRVTASVSPPSGPSEPHGFDFQRYAWFRALGAVGYTRKPVEVVRQAELENWRLRVFDLRLRLSQSLRHYLPEKEGGFAAAILTGDRAHVDQGSLDHLRRSNLAHLLAISGLHMGLLTGVVFVFLRAGLALWPRVGLRVSGKKVAAALALVAGFSYLIISGAAVATERAFIMVAVMLGAIIVDRPAISLRAVAIAALIILTFWPENLLSAGFQMSFAATTALVVVFRWLGKYPPWRALQRGSLRIVYPLIGLLASSFVAGMATAPFSAYHFNQVSHYGMLANAMSLPIMGMVVMPAAVLALLLSLIGLQALPLWVMGLGISWILAVAQWVSGLDGVVSMIPQAGPNALAVMVVGGMLAILLDRWQKMLGLALVLVGMSIWVGADRPDVLVSGNGRIVGIMQDDQRVLNRKRGNGFSARTWLENDGRVFDQPALAAAFVGDDDFFDVKVSGQSILYLWQKDVSEQTLHSYCRDHAVVIAPKYTDWINGTCEIWGAKRLKQDGSLAFIDGAEGLKIETARQENGTRLWNSYRQRKNTLFD